MKGGNSGLDKILSLYYSKTYLTAEKLSQDD